MADEKISALPAAANVAVTDIFPTVKSGVTGKATPQQILDMINGLATFLMGNSNVGVQSDGRVGIGTTDWTLYPYEKAIAVKNGDTKFGVYNLSGVLDGSQGASITMGFPTGVNNNGNAPGFEIQCIPNADPTATVLKINYLERSITNGTVLSNVAGIIAAAGDGSVWFLALGVTFTAAGLTVPGALDFDAGNIFSDGIGNLTASSFNGLGSGLTGLPTSTQYTAYAAGTPYTMTATPAQVAFGTTSPAVTLSTAGTYLIMAASNLQYVAATYAGNQTASLKLRRTNNTASDLPNATRTIELRIITTITDDAGIVSIPAVVYTASAGDIIQIYGSVSATPAAGSVQCTSAEIIAVRIA